MNGQFLKVLGILGCVLLSSGCMTPVLDKADDTSTAILDVFPESAVQMPAGQRGRTELSSTYTPSGSLWGKHLDEKTVFNVEIKHLQGPGNSCAVRIGKGGQLYSLRGPFGESIPPQGIRNPWNDEVWQFVSVCSKYNGISRAKGLSADVLARFESSPYRNTYFIHNSGAYMPARVDSGTITLSCDILLDRDEPGVLDIIMRDTTGSAQNTFGKLHVEAGRILFNEERIADATPGVWHHVAFSFELGGTSGKQGSVTVKNGEGAGTTVTVPLAGPQLKAFTWLGLSAGGEKRGVINVDNLAVKRVTDTQTEWPIKDDFEENIGLSIHGCDQAKGSDIFLSDRVAASGRKSLEIHDAAGLEHGWQPMLRLGVQTTLAGNLYCPLLGAAVPADGRSYRTVNWGIIPQLKTIHRSPILYYVQTRDVGDGVIEMTYVVHNFSVRDDIVFDWLNAPWGGTRRSRLPFHYLSSPEGELRDRDWMREVIKGGAIGVRETGGWNLSCAGEAPDSPSLALVFGRDKNLESELRKVKQGLPHCQFDGSIYRHMETHWPEDWATRPENSWRNYEVAVVIPRFRLAPGTTIWYRSFLVVNRRDRAVELAKSLVDKVDYGLCTFAPETTPMVPGVRGQVSGLGKPAFELFAKPVPGTMPLFLIENAATGREVITTDPYIFVPKESLDYGVPPEHPLHDYYGKAVGYSLDVNNSKWKRLLGYGYVSKPASEGWARLSSLVAPEQFPEATVHHLDLWVKEQARRRP